MTQSVSNDNKQLFSTGKVEVNDILTFAGTETYVKGTLLARNSGTDKLEYYDEDSATGSLQEPVAVLDYEVTKGSAGDLGVKVAVAGECDIDRLIEHSVGALTTKAQRDKIIANTGIIPTSVKGL